MNTKHAAVPAAFLALALSAPAFAQSDDAVIHFADLNGIENWEVSDDGDALLIEGRNGDWYKATFWARCPSLRFSQAIGFVTDATGDLDRFSSIIADGERCRFRTLEETEAPE